MLFVVLFGLGYDRITPVAVSLRANSFGRKAYATIKGYTTLFTVITGIAHPIIAGWSYDFAGSYTIAFAIITVLQALAILIVSLAKKPMPQTSCHSPR